MTNRPASHRSEDPPPTPRWWRLGLMWQRITRLRLMGKGQNRDHRDALCSDGMLSAGHGQRPDLRGAAREPKAGHQAYSSICGFGGRAESSPGQGPAEGHGRARACAFRWSGHRGNDREFGARRLNQIRGSRCETSYPCTSARDAEPERGTATRAEHRRCRTAAAECTADCRQEPRRAIKTPSNMASTQQKPLHGVDRFHSWCAQ